MPRRPAGEGRPFVGGYREIAPPARLVFTTPGPSPGSETVGTLVFDERDGLDELTMRMSCATARIATRCCGLASMPAPFTRSTTSTLI